jgi:hypothetical protein
MGFTTYIRRDSGKSIMRVDVTRYLMVFPGTSQSTTVWSLYVLSVPSTFVKSFACLLPTMWLAGEMLVVRIHKMALL